MIHIITILVLTLFSTIIPFQVHAEQQEDSPPTEKALPLTHKPEESDKITSSSVVSAILLYVPNRILDFFDIFRVRVRVGPGIAVGVRATKVAQAYIGSYTTVYAGLPGPRRAHTIKLPFGLESHNGAALSLADATLDGGIGPDYSSTEIGASAQLAVVGFDFGIDPLEIVDFATGIVGIDVTQDDL